MPSRVRGAVLPPAPVQDLGVAGRDGTSWVSATLAASAGLGLVVSALAPADGRSAVAQVALVAAPLAAATGCLAAARRQRGRRHTDRRIRRGWWWLGTAAAMWAAGTAAWSLGPATSPAGIEWSWPVVGWLGWVVPAIVGMLQFPLPRREVSRRRAVADWCLLATSLTLLSWILIADPALGGTSPAGSLLLALAYPATDVTVAGLALAAAMRAPAGARRPWTLVSVGLLILTATDIAYVRVAATTGYLPGSLLDLGWVTAFLLMAVATLVPTHPRPTVQPGPALPGLWQAAIPMLPLLAAIVTAAVRGISPRHDTLLFGLLLVVLAVALVRHVVLLAESRELLAESTKQGQHANFQANHDPLTGLANRAALTRHAHAALQRGRSCALVVIDLDDFKQLNDSLGHAVGDQLLVAVAGRLRSVVRSQDMLARLGGDEFGVLVLSEAGDAAATAATLSQRILASLSRPLSWPHGQRSVRASVGAATAPEDAVTGDELLRNADLAMYAAKDAGKNTYRHYDPPMHARVMARLHLESALPTALAHNEFTLHYQPILDLTDGKVRALEALLRWERPDGSAVSPAEFIPAAEATGLIGPLGGWVLERACTQARTWQRTLPGAANLSVAVNVSAAQLVPGFPDVVASVLRTTGLSPHCLTVEVTESVLTHDVSLAAQTLGRLREHGVRVSVDDFGTGYSSLARLRELPVDELKIDRSFVAALPDPHATSLVAGILTMAHGLGLDVVAEGIEHERELGILQAHGCTLAQGYLIGRPQPAGRTAGALRLINDSAIWPPAGTAPGAHPGD